MKNTHSLARLVDLVAAGLDRHRAALDLVTAQGTAIGASIAALAASTGDSLAIRNTGNATPARLLQLWADTQAAGTLRVRSPKFHDNVQGVRFDTLASDPTPLWGMGLHQAVYPNDVLSVELAGSAVAGDIEYICMLMYYPELPGTSARFITREELLRRSINIFTVENTLALGTAGGYSGSEAINVEFDQFHAGGLYALIGYKVDVECAAVAWRGADTGNLRVGGPGLETDPLLTTDWFGALSDAYKLPLIPVFSAENKGGILVDGVQDENGADVTLTSIFVELSR